MSERWIRLIGPLSCGKKNIIQNLQAPGKILEVSANFSTNKKLQKLFYRKPRRYCFQYLLEALDSFEGSLDMAMECLRDREKNSKPHTIIERIPLEVIESLIIVFRQVHYLAEQNAIYLMDKLEFLSHLRKHFIEDICNETKVNIVGFEIQHAEQLLETIVPECSEQILFWFPTPSELEKGKYRAVIEQYLLHLKITHHEDCKLFAYFGNEEIIASQLNTWLQNPHNEAATCNE